MNEHRRSFSSPNAMPVQLPFNPQATRDCSRHLAPLSLVEDCLDAPPVAEAFSPIGGAAKRAMDVAIALIALVMALPFMVMVALAIKLTTGGPVIFAHKRIGFRGRVFDCYKFRTMIPDAQKELDRYLASDPQAASEWADRRKLANDPRITALGRILRVSSLDELPQLVNILRGEMSCVGPRPIIADELELYGSAAEYYLKSRPGLTGVWQVSGRNNVSYPERVQMDLDYVLGWSLKKDVEILMKTLVVVINFDGS